MDTVSLRCPVLYKFFLIEGMVEGKALRFDGIQFESNLVLLN